MALSVIVGRVPVRDFHSVTALWLALGDAGILFGLHRFAYIVNTSAAANCGRGQALVLRIIVAAPATSKTYIMWSALQAGTYSLAE